MWYIKIIGITLLGFGAYIFLCWLSDKIEDSIKKKKRGKTHEKQ